MLKAAIVNIWTGGQKPSYATADEKSIFFRPQKCLRF